MIRLMNMQVAVPILFVCVATTAEFAYGLSLSLRTRTAIGNEQQVRRVQENLERTLAGLTPAEREQFRLRWIDDAPAD